MIAEIGPQISLSSTSPLFKLSSVLPRLQIISFGPAMWPPAGKLVEAALHLRGITEFNWAGISQIHLCSTDWAKELWNEVAPKCKTTGTTIAPMFLLCFRSIG